MKITSNFKINIPQAQKTQVKDSKESTSPIKQTSLPAFRGNASQITYSGAALLEELLGSSYGKKETLDEIQKINEIAVRFADEDSKTPTSDIKNGYYSGDIELKEDERKFLQDFLRKHTYRENSDFSDEKLLIHSCRLASGWQKERKELLAGIKEAFKEPENKEIMNEEELNSISSNFFENIAPKLSIKELQDAKALIYRARGNAEKLKFDYSILAKRRIAALCGALSGNRYPYMDLVCDFLYCSDDDFEEKIKRLTQRPELLNCSSFGRLDLSFDSWKAILNMDEEEYLKKTTPNARRKTKKTDLDLFKSQVETRAQKPIEYDENIAQKLIKRFNIQVIDKNYTPPKTLYKFEPLAQAKKVEVPLLELPSIESKLENNEDINFSIPDKGGTCPTRTEEPVIRPEDYERLNKTQSAKKTIKYGAKINWSNEKIARDILQNFYDGNGHTLEGTDFSFEANENGKYTVTIKGLGNYDYKHIEYTGSSTKDDDYESAGFYGEGTKILAVNLLSRPDTSSVEYGCGEWKVTLGRSSDNLKEALMTQTLGKNEDYVEGNYIKFETEDKDLIRTLIRARNYFYHPYNPDFYNFDYENEFFGIKFLPKNENGNLYLIQRYKSDMPMQGVSVVFKKDPNDPELINKNHWRYNMTDRDRSALSSRQIVDLFSRYIKTMSDEDLSKMVCSMQFAWDLDIILHDRSTYFESEFLYKLLDEMYSRSIGIDFGNKYVLDDETEVSRDMMHNLGYRIGISKMSKAGMKPHEDSIKKPKTPDKTQTRKIRILDEGLRVLQDNADVSQMELIKENEVDTPKYVFADKDCPNLCGEAIIDKNPYTGLGRFYKGHWVKEGYLARAPFETILGTWLHELSHKAGSDDSKAFSQQLIKVHQMVLDILINNRTALQKMIALKEMYDNTKVKNIPIDMEVYKAQLLQMINQQGYSTGNYEEKLNSIKRNYGKRFNFQNNMDSSSEKPVKTLPDTYEFIGQLLRNGSVRISIPNDGGAKPSKSESAAINPNDTKRLGKEESAYIAIKYGAKINWSNEKIARDIMQNFYDGNGYTLEGVDIEVEQRNDGKFKVKIKGLGEYDYEHIENIGSSTKDDDPNSAGFYGEGTGIVAVNLLSKLGVPYVEYSSGDWKMTFGRSSDDIKEAVMTQTLTKNEERVEGNYVEFVTDDKDLVTSIIKSKDYFYHPYNEDFQNLVFENEFFGFKVCPNKEGNLYYIQRYQDASGKIEKPLRGIGVVFKKAISNNPIGTGRDRTEIDYNTLFYLAYDYAKTMSTNELVKAICDLASAYTEDCADSLTFREPDSTIYFIKGLVEEATNRRIQIDFDSQKIVANTTREFDASPVGGYLRRAGYKFAPQFMTKIGMKTDTEVYKSLNLKKSVTPTEIEEKKLKVLKEAISLLCLEAKDKNIYMYESKEYSEHFTSLKDEAGVMIDREYMKKTDFISILSELLAQIYDRNNNKEFSTFSYELTNQIKDELSILIQNPGVAQKLKVMEEVYNGIEPKEV